MSSQRTKRPPGLPGLLVGQAMLAVLAVAIGLLVFIDPVGNLRIDAPGLLYGVGGAVTLLGMGGLLRLFPDTRRDLIQQMLDLMAKAGVTLSWPAIVLMGLTAGICEELLFRGVFQVWLTRDVGLWAGLLLPNILFAIMHPHSKAYMAYVFTIGLFLALLMIVSGGLLAPMIAHGLYDIVALWWLRKSAQQLTQS